jgi:hypothetical protein
VTATGQLSTSLSGETVFSLNRKEAERRLSELNIQRNDPDKFLSGLISSAKRLSGYKEPSESDKPVFTGRINRIIIRLRKIYQGRGRLRDTIPSFHTIVRREKDYVISRS